MKEIPPVNLGEYRTLLQQRSYYQRHIDNINLRLAEIASGAELLGERQLRARLPIPLKPLDGI